MWHSRLQIMRAIFHLQCRRQADVHQVGAEPAGIKIRRKSFRDFRRIFQEIFLSQRRQLLQCLLSDNRLHMLGKVRIQSRCKPPDIRVFRENVADLVELFGSTVRLTENQVVAAVLRIFVQGIRTIVDRAEYSGYVDHVIQCTENIKTGELLQIFIIEELRSCRLFLGGFLCSCLLYTSARYFLLYIRYSPHITITGITARSL